MGTLFQVLIQFSSAVLSPSRRQMTLLGPASRGFDSETGSASTAPGYGRSKRAWKNLR
jgi:hypothetical protein